MEAVSQMLASISKVQSAYNNDLSIEGFLLTMFDPKLTLNVEISMQVRSLFKENTFLTQIPRNVSIPESSYHRMPVTSYKPTSSGSFAYLALAKEIIDKE
jgi:chromosome partitioning protein